MASDWPSYIFGGNAADLSLQELKRRQAIAAAVAGRQRKMPTTLGEGLTYFSENIADAMEQRRLNEAEKAYLAREDAARGRAPGASFGTGAPTRSATTPAAAAPSIATPTVAPNANPNLGGGLLNPAPIPPPGVGPPAASGPAVAPASSSGGQASLGAPIVPPELTDEQNDGRNRLTAALGG